MFVLLILSWPTSLLDQHLFRQPLWFERRNTCFNIVQKCNLYSNLLLEMWVTLPWFTIVNLVSTRIQTSLAGSLHHNLRMIKIHEWGLVLLIAFQIGFSMPFLTQRKKLPRLKSSAAYCNSIKKRHWFKIITSIITTTKHRGLFVILQ
jgi:hypothetical protein